MFSLKSMLFAATAALAGVAMAAPAAGNDALVARDSALVARGCSGSGCNTIPLILNNVIDQCALITVDLKAAIKAAVKIGGKVDISVVKPFILKVVAVVNVAVEQLKVIATVDLKVILAGLSVTACAELVVKVIVAICAVLQICLDVVLVLQVAACLTLILQVSAAIIALLKVLIDICVSINLKAAIVAYLLAHLDIIALIKACGLVDVLLFLGIV